MLKKQSKRKTPLNQTLKESRYRIGASLASKRSPKELKQWVATPLGSRLKERGFIERASGHRLFEGRLLSRRISSFSTLIVEVWHGLEMAIPKPTIIKIIIYLDLPTGTLFMLNQKGIARIQNRMMEISFLISRKISFGQRILIQSLAIDLVWAVLSLTPSNKNSSYNSMHRSSKASLSSSSILTKFFDKQQNNFLSKEASQVLTKFLMSEQITKTSS